MYVHAKEEGNMYRILFILSKDFREREREKKRSHLYIDIYVQMCKYKYGKEFIYII